YITAVNTLSEGPPSNMVNITLKEKENNNLNHDNNGTTQDFTENFGFIIGFIIVIIIILILIIFSISRKKKPTEIRSSPEDSLKEPTHSSYDRSSMNNGNERMQAYPGQLNPSLYQAQPQPRSQNKINQLK
ncbi:hypothetical protein, partial [[Eubacterium] cellulosolvens]